MGSLQLGGGAQTHPRHRPGDKGLTALPPWGAVVQMTPWALPWGSGKQREAGGDGHARHYHLPVLLLSQVELTLPSAPLGGLADEREASTEGPL